MHSQVRLCTLYREVLVQLFMLFSTGLKFVMKIGTWRDMGKRQVWYADILSTAKH